jgi:hypothetical protein
LVLPRPDWCSDLEKDILAMKVFSSSLCLCVSCSYIVPHMDHKKWKKIQNKLNFFMGHAYKLLELYINTSSFPGLKPCILWLDLPSGNKVTAAFTPVFRCVVSQAKNLRLLLKHPAQCSLGYAYKVCVCSMCGFRVCRIRVTPGDTGVTFGLLLGTLVQLSQCAWTVCECVLAIVIIHTSLSPSPIEAR